MSLRFQKMGRTAYWQEGLQQLASLPLGDAHPGGTWPYARGEQLRGSAATTPRAAGPSLFLCCEGRGAGPVPTRASHAAAAHATPPGVLPAEGRRLAALAAGLSGRTP